MFFIETCEISNGTCKNGAECKERDTGDFCECKKGTSGHRCEIIDECESLKCKKSISVCSYNSILEEAFCKCKKNNAVYDPKNKKCDGKHW